MFSHCLFLLVVERKVSGLMVYIRNDKTEYLAVRHALILPLLEGSRNDAGTGFRFSLSAHCRRTKPTTSIARCYISPASATTRRSQPFCSASSPICRFATFTAFEPITTLPLRYALKEAPSQNNSVFPAICRHLQIPEEKWEVPFSGVFRG